MADGCWPDRFLSALATRHVPSAIRPGKAAVAGLEPASDSLTGSRLTIRPHRNCGKWLLACGQRDSGHVPFANERPAGVEPAHPPWQGDRLPLHHGRYGEVSGEKSVMSDQRQKFSLLRSPPASHLPPVGCTELSKNGPRTESCVLSRAPGGTRTHVAALRMRSPGRLTTGAEERSAIRAISG